MDSNTFIIAAAQGEFAARLGDALWTAYGGPVKMIGTVALIIVIGVPALAFLRRLVK